MLCFRQRGFVLLLLLLLMLKKLTLGDGILKLLANQGHQQLAPDKGSVALGRPEVPCASVLILGILPQGLDTLVDEVERASQGQTLRARDVVVHRPKGLSGRAVKKG